MLPVPRQQYTKLQWHITDRCNWGCKHCYQDSKIHDELTTAELFSILDNYTSFIKKMNIPKSNARLNITGGEPFSRDNILDIVGRVGDLSHFYNWGFLSNGSYLTPTILKELKKNHIGRYQVSLEGLERQNDLIRGQGSYKKTMSSIKMLLEAGIQVSVSTTITRKNMLDIPELIDILERIGVSYFGARRLIPVGSAADIKDTLLQPKELQRFYQEIAEIKKGLKKRNSNLKITFGCESGVFNLENHSGKNHHCGAVSEGGIFTIMPNGDVMTCRRLPIVVGNALKEDLFDIFYRTKKLWDIRNLNNAHPFCKKCDNFMECFGGAKCVNYTYTGKLNIPDVQCWNFFDEIKDSSYFKDFQDVFAEDMLLHPELKQSGLTQDSIERLCAGEEVDFNDQQGTNQKGLCPDTENNEKQGHKLRLKIGNSCNSNCSICNALNIKSPDDKSFLEIKSMIDELKENNIHRIALPCNADSRKDFVKIIKYMKSLGLWISLETNARMFSIKAFADTVSSYVDEYIIFDFGREERYEFNTGIDGHKQYLQGVDNIAATGTPYLFIGCDVRMPKPDQDLEKPFEVVIEVTPECNFDCNLCFNKNSFAKDSRDPGAMSSEYIKEVIDSISDAGIEIVRFSGGEPLLREDIFDLMEYAKQKGLKIWLNTNGTLIDKTNLRQIEKLVDNILVPLNGYDAKSDELWTMTNGSFKKKLRGISLLMGTKIPIIRCGTALTSDNIVNLEKILDLVKQLGIHSWEVYRPIMKASGKEDFDINTAVDKLIRLNIEYGRPIALANAVPFCSYDHHCMEKICNGAIYDDGHSRLVIDPRGYAKPSYFIDKNIGDPRDIMKCWNHEFMQDMRGLLFVPEECRGCIYINRCKGGSRYSGLLNSHDIKAQDSLMTKKISSNSVQQ